MYNLSVPIDAHKQQLWENAGCMLFELWLFIIWSEASTAHFQQQKLKAAAVVALL